MIALPAFATNLYVSPQGDDHNAGTEDSPVRTLEHARNLVRGMNQAMTDDITVYLAAGAYRLTQPFTLTPADSGTNGFSVIYTAASADAPILMGSIQVTGWTQVDAARNLWAAPAPAGVANSRQLYINGVRALRARGRLPVTLTETPTGYTTSGPTLASWRNPSDIEFVYTGGNDLWSEGSYGLGPWTEPRCPVASIDATSITMVQPAWDNCTKRVENPTKAADVRPRPANLVGPASVGKRPEYIENAFELLGTPGQWYFDRAKHMLYYTPRIGEDLGKADVEIPVLEKLVDGQGTPDQPVQNIIFKGLQFSYATWLYPSSKEGFPEIQANYLVTGEKGYAVQGLGDIVPGGLTPYGAWTSTSANVTFVNDHGVQFLEDAFVHLGGAGLQLGNGSQRDVVEGCVFTDISANGVELGGVDLPEADEQRVTRDNRISDNHFYNIATEFHGGIAIVAGYTQRTLIQFNQIDHVPYAAISMGWGGWPDKIKRPGVANNSREAVVANNLIHDLMLLLADGGGIYTQGLTGPTLAEGEKVVGNVVYEQFSSGHAIYSDNGSCNMTVAGNVMFHTNHDNWGAPHADYYNGETGANHDPISVLNNSWEQGTPDAKDKGVTWAGNSLISALDQAPTSTLAKAGLERTYRSILQKQFSAPSAPEAPTRVAVATVNSTAYLTWNPSANEGTAPVTAYTATASSGQTVTISAAEFAKKAYVSLSGLVVDQPVTFTVTATNAVGTSPASLPSEILTPIHNRRAKLPAAPGKAEAFVSHGRASLHFMAPAEDKKAVKVPVLSYLVTISPGGRQVALEGRRVLTLSGTHVTFETFDGLDPQTAYSFTLAAVNPLGAGPAIPVVVK